MKQQLSSECLVAGASAGSIPATQDEEEVDLTGSGDEQEDNASKARKKLGLPEYDPTLAMLEMMPKFLPHS